MEKQDQIYVEETRMYRVTGGLTFGSLVHRMDVQELRGVFSRDYRLFQEVLKGSKKQEFNNLTAFEDSCYSDEWEFYCLYPNVPMGRIGNHNLNQFNFNTTIAHNRILIKVLSGTVGNLVYSTSTYQVMIEVDWCGTYNITDTLVLKNRKYHTLKDYKAAHNVNLGNN